MSVPADDPFVFRARPRRAVDGDTIEVLADLGFDISVVIRVRIADVDTPEIFRPKSAAGLVAGRAAKDFTQEWLDAAGVDGWPLLLLTRKGRSFNRYVADVWRLADGSELGSDLLAAGHAVLA